MQKRWSKQIVGVFSLIFLCCFSSCGGDGAPPQEVDADEMPPIQRYDHWVAKPESPFARQYLKTTGKEPTLDNVLNSLIIGPPLGQTKEERDAEYRRWYNKQNEISLATHLIIDSPHTREALSNCYDFTMDESLQGDCLWAALRLGYEDAESIAPNYLRVSRLCGFSKFLTLEYMIELLVKDKTTTKKLIPIRTSLLVEGALIQDPRGRARPELAFPAVTILSLMQQHNLALREDYGEPEKTTDHVLQELSNAMEQLRRNLARKDLILPPPNLPPEEGGDASPVQ